MLLRDRKVVVTGGPTREWIDPVRYISNPSTGKMGAALADAAAPLARETVFIHGPVSPALVKEKPYRCVAVSTTVDLLEAVLGEMEDGAVLIMAAAPADYRPAERLPEKMKKRGDELILRLVKNPDILMEVAGRRSNGAWRDVFVAGFAAETTDTESCAREKLIRKNLDMICLNDVSAAGAGFAGDTNIITIFTRVGSRIELPVQAKESAAARIIDCIMGAL
jgi:phosphopantothenoylcysteine decarboxylase / phosphopantothenate---cysteine ligase